MFNGKYISVDRIIERFYTDYGFRDQVDWSLFIEWISDCIGIMGVPIGYLDKTAKIEVTDYRGELPCDFYMQIGIRDYNNMTAYVEASDIYHYSDNTISQDQVNLRKTYTINDNYIKTSAEEATIELSYKAIKVDKRGYPMIPDDDKVIRMLISYLGYKTAFRMVTTGQIDERRYNIIEREYFFNAGAAMTRLLTPSLDKMEVIKNAFLRLIPKINEHANGFKTVGEPEQRIKY